MSLIANNAKALYKKLYPNLTIEEIEDSIIDFNEEAIKDARIDPCSANWTKYQRGWLMRVNSEKGEKVAK